MEDLTTCDFLLKRIKLCLSKEDEEIKKIFTSPNIFLNKIDDDYMIDLFYPNMKLLYDATGRFLSSRRFTEQCRKYYNIDDKLSHNISLIDNIEIVKTMKLIRNYNHNKYIESKYKYKKIFSSIFNGEYQCFGKKNYLLAVLSWENMTLYWFENNIELFLKEPVNVQNDIILKIIKRYCNMMENISCSTFIDRDENIIANNISLVVKLYENEDNSNVSLTPEKMKENMNNIYDIFKSNIGYCVPDKRNIRKKYINIVRNLMYSTKNKVINSKKDGFTIGYKIDSLFKKHGWIQISSNIEDMNIKQMIETNYLSKNIFWYKPVNIVPTKFINGQILYHIDKDKPELQNLLKRITVHELYITIDFKIYGRTETHANILKNGEACTGDFKFNLDKIDEFENSIVNLEEMYYTMNYDSYYNSGELLELMKYCKKDKDETKQEVSLIKDLNEESTLVRL